MNINGDIGLMPLPDVLFWAEANKKTGTLTIKRQESVKRFYIEDGRILFLFSQEDGERFIEFFSSSGSIERRAIETAVKESHRLCVPLTGYLISEGVLAKETLERLLSGLVESALAGALGWDEGTFEFTDSMPPMIGGGPVRLVISRIIANAGERQGGGEDPEANRQKMIKQLVSRISGGNIDLPSIPSIMQRLNEAIGNENTSVQEIVKIVMSDQILTSKVLRVVNSAFYSPPSRITSLHQSIAYIGLKSVLSIATAHALTLLSSKDTARVRAVLQHSLACAFVAKKIAPAADIDPEEAFVCGLLHDIGKTVMLHLTSDAPFTEEERLALLREYHHAVGFMLASKWNLPEMVRNVIRFHHSPDKAEEHNVMVEAVYAADALANGLAAGELVPQYCNSLEVEKLSGIEEELCSIKSSVVAII
ncbi:MAG: HDOD domain-containing protein [Nitrospiraceae bacterium]|nr:HDOD domain-containing protein [Nitrospiraceae bacterium]